MRKLDVAGILLVVVGALNWGFVAIAEFDLVASLFGLNFGETTAITRIVYGLVGIAGVYVAARATALVRGTGRERPVLAQAGPFG